MADYAIHDTTLTGISNVIRKKDGTSALIDPADYADRINLMGMLEEKTVSGTIAHIEDGADEVPIKSWEVSLPASLDGYSEVDVKHAGANLLDFTVRDHFGITCEKTADGGAKMSGTATNTSYPVNWVPLTLPAGTYHIYISAVGTGMTISYSKNGGYGGNLYTGDNVITLNAETEIGGYIRVSNGTVISEPETVYMQLSVAQADYEPYTAPTTHTAQLGRTIYGGTADVVKGTGESSYKIITVGNSGWNYYASGGYIYKDFNDKVTPTVGDTDHVLVTDNPDMPYGGVNYASQFQDLHVYQAQNKAIYIKDTSCTSLNDFYTKYSAMKIGYELATPETFTFTPITPTPETALGVNNFWADSGDSEVTYRGQGTVTVYPNAEEASF